MASLDSRLCGPRVAPLACHRRVLVPRAGGTCNAPQNPLMSLWSDIPRPFFVLAPMEDVTDTSYRRLLRRWARRFGAPGPAVVFTEFTRTDTAIRSTRDNPDSRLRFHEDERPVVAQIWGTRPEEFYRAAASLEELGFDGIDLNMGCPAWKIRKSGACSGLIANRPLAAEIIMACREGTSLPLSVKTRIGLSNRVTEEWCGHLLAQGIDALTVHGRIADQMSDDWADWREVRRVREIRDAMARQTVIIGNGDVLTLEHGRRLVEQTGIDGVMIGRGIFFDPLLFSRDGVVPVAPWEAMPRDERLCLLAEQIRAFHDTWQGTRNYEILKKFYRNYFLPHDPEEQVMLRRMYTTGTAAAALRLVDSVAPLPRELLISHEEEEAVMDRWWSFTDA